MAEINVSDSARKVAGYVVFGAIVLNTINSLSRFRILDSTDKLKIIYNRTKENLAMKEEN